MLRLRPWTVSRLQNQIFWSQKVFCFVQCLFRSFSLFFNPVSSPNAKQQKSMSYLITCTIDPSKQRQFILLVHVVVVGFSVLWDPAPYSGCLNCKKSVQKKLISNFKIFFLVHCLLYEYPELLSSTALSTFFNWEAKVIDVVAFLC